MNGFKKELLFLICLIGVSTEGYWLLAQRQFSGFESALRQVLQDPSGLDRVWLSVSCQTEAGPGAVEIFGSGIGIWRGQRQFQISSESVQRLLNKIVDDGFVGWNSTYGGKEDPKQPKFAASVVCQVEVRIGERARSVAQFDKGKQFLPLRKLATWILQTCQEPAQVGIEIADLTQGLAKLASGEVVPEASKWILHQKTGSQGWILRIQGRQAVVEIYDQQGGEREKKGFRLSVSEMQSLARVFSERRFAQLPINLYSERYTDLLVEILGRNRSLQARRFAAMTPDTHGQQQDHFEALLAVLVDLQERIVQRGESLPLP